MMMIEENIIFEKEFLNPWRENSRMVTESVSKVNLKRFLIHSTGHKNKLYKGMSFWSDKELYGNSLKKYIEDNLKDLGLLISSTNDIEIARMFSETYSCRKGLNNVCFVLELDGDRFLDIKGEEKEVIVYNPKIVKIVEMKYRKRDV